LIKELQSLGLDIKVLDVDEREIDLKQSFDEEDDMGIVNAEEFDYSANDAEFEEEGYITGDVEDSDFFSDDDDDEDLGDLGEY
jgi:DNA-directed RNA polymerase subunit beta